MNEIICIPIDENRGLLSPMAPHFGRAPSFLLVDAANLAHRPIANERGEDRCDPYRALAAVPVDVFIVGGIGPHALEEMTRRHITVYQAPQGNVADALAGYVAGKLPRVLAATQLLDVRRPLAS